MTEGQSFQLGLISALAQAAGDCDHAFPNQCKTGLPLGVEEVLPDTAHICPSKKELPGVDQHKPHIEPPTQAPNYQTTKERGDAIEATYPEDRALGMVSGPHTQKPKQPKSTTAHSKTWPTAPWRAS